MPHEPGATEMCETDHCYFHNEDESFGQDFMACGECSHVYQTEQDLVGAFNEMGRQGAEEAIRNGWFPVEWTLVEDADQVWFCPLCSHDF